MVRERAWWLCAVVLALRPTAQVRAEAQVDNPAPERPMAISVQPARAASVGGIPRFFEIGKQVRINPGEELVDTTAWVYRSLEQDATHKQALPTATADDGARLFTYAESDPVSRQVKQYALVMPKNRSHSSNGRVVADWGPSADAFNFGVESARSFGSLTAFGAEGGPPVIRRLKRVFEPTGANVQDYQLVYEIEATGLDLLEHKGLVPGLPVSFERFTIYDRGVSVLPDAEPGAFSRADSFMTLKIGLVSSTAPAWASLETFDAEGYRVLLATDPGGQRYFLAAPLALDPSVYFGGVAADLVVESDAPLARDSARQESACALFLPHASSGTVLSGTVADKAEIADLLGRAAAFLAAHDQAIADLRAHAGGARSFLRHYTETFLHTHESRADPRAITELPYGDHRFPANALDNLGSIRYGSDQASALLGLVSYQRQTNDPSVVESIWGIAESSMEAMTPAGAVWNGRFENQVVAEEEDASTGRADVFIDNGGVSVSFNRVRMVIRSGYPRAAGVTWGAFSPVIAGVAEPVDGGRYAFSVDGSSIPEGVRGDQEALAVTRLFTRQDGKVRVRETASLARGVPAVRVRYQVENTGAAPLRVDELRMSIGDFFDHGDGSIEISQNRYGFSPVVEGASLHVGLWMEGMNEPLWGDNFAAGGVDLTDVYRKHRSRYLVVYGYDRAQVYYLPREADQVIAYNVADHAREGGAVEPPSTRLSSQEGDRGWTRLELRYKVARIVAPSQVVDSPPVYSYLLRAPLYSADGDTVPDELQSIVPLWTELVETAKDFATEPALRAHLDALSDRARARRLQSLLHTALEPDDASVALQAAWMESADLMAELAARTRNLDERLALDRRWSRVQENALRGAAYSLTTLTELRGRSDLMPSYGLRRDYAFHVLVFDWAYRATGDSRYRDAMLYVANMIANPEDKGGLQITDPRKPNFGGYVISERSRAQGTNSLDDQGMKLWALRVAYERTGDPKYRRSAELFIDHWIKVRPDDHRFFGSSKRFDRYVVTGPEQQMTALGQYSLLVGLRAWGDLHPRAAQLYEEGLKSATERHPVDAIGIAGAIERDSAGGSSAVHFGTGAEVGSTFLLALTFDPARLKGRWSAGPRKPEHPIAAVRRAKRQSICPQSSSHVPC